MKRRRTGKQDDVGPSVGDALLQLNDDFAEYHSMSAFLCTAFTSVMSTHHPLEEAVIQGARQCAELLQARGDQLKSDLGNTRHLYIGEQDAKGAR